MSKFNDFVFDIGEQVIYSHRSTGLPCKIVDRKRVKDDFLSTVWGVPVYVNCYITEEVYKIKNRISKRLWDNPEFTLVSADTEKPELAVDYESDERVADFIDKDGNILKTVKAGKIGRAHEIVSGHFN